MNIHEYQAKEILRKYGVPTSEGVVIFKKDEINNIIDKFNAKKYVVKAQIHAGGRGKAGGIKIAGSKEEAKKLAYSMLGSTLITEQTLPGGKKVECIYIEEACDILKEYYFSLVLDRNKERLIFLVSTEGGVNIEKVSSDNKEKIITISIDPIMGLNDFHCRHLALSLELNTNQAKQLTRIANAIYKIFLDNDANQIEINPLVLTNDGNLIALDAKINFDDNALFLHPDIAAMRDESEEDPLEIEASKAGFSYIKMHGNIGCMVNGAGLAMATMDIIKFYGAEPANFLDVGGGADLARVTKAFKIILSDKAVKGILVNIFGGIMHCDIIAMGIVEAAKDIGITVPLVVRLAGTNFELGNKILASSGLKIIAANDLGDAANKIVEAIRGFI